MKSIVFLLMLLLCTCPIHAQWGILNDGLVGDEITFTSEDVGWMTNRNLLIKSSNGGENWEKVPLNDTWQFEQFYFFSDSLFFALAWSETSQGDYLIKTKDGGESWIESYQLPSDNYIIDISFAADSIIFLAVRENADPQDKHWILKTKDQGETWQKLPLTYSSQYMYIRTLHFLSPENGFILVDVDTNLVVLKTTDGAKTWQDKIINELDNIGDVQIAGDSTIYFLASKWNDDNSEYMLAETKNMFETWSVITQHPFPIYAFYVVSDGSIFSVMSDSLSTNIMKTVNGGLSWKILKNDLESRGGWRSLSYYKLIFTPKNVGYLLFSIGGANGLYKSTDYGETWYIDTLNPDFQGIHFFDTQKGFIYGNQYIFHGNVPFLFSLAKGGNVWDIESLNFFSYIISMVFPTDLTGYGLHGWQISKTTDGGNNWNICFENNYDSLGFDFNGNAISALNDHLIYVVGDGQWSGNSSGAAILGSSDGGENWELMWKYPSDDENHYAFYSSYIINNVLWAVGRNGLIVKMVSPDSFRVFKMNTDFYLENVYFNDDNHGWINGSYYEDDQDHFVLLKTQNGGESWLEKDLGIYRINDMYFADSLQGWAVGYDSSYSGCILVTENGAESWDVQVSGLSGSLNALHFKEGVGWAVGENGLVLRTDNWVVWFDQRTGEKYPSRYHLFQNYPNPFNPATTIRYDVKTFYGTSQHVNLSIYNLLGQKVSTLVDKKQPAGNYRVEWDATDYASGVYLYTLKAGNNYKQTKKLILLK